MLENLGEVSCPFHESPVLAKVRRNKNGRLFFSCPECGPVHTHGGQAAVEWILTHATMYSPRTSNNGKDDSRRENRVSG